MHTLLSVLAVGLFVLVAAPQNALGCHQGAPHGNETSCDGAGAPGSGVFQFVGFTDDVNNSLDDTIDGGQTMLEMHPLCQDDFGPQARMCTEKEFHLSPNAAPPASTDAWLHPTIFGDFTFLGHHSGKPTNDFFRERFTCEFWNNNSATLQGFAVDTNGRTQTRDCDVDRPVTCCAPAQ